MNTNIFKKFKLLKIGFVPALLLIAFATGVSAKTHSDYNKSFNFAQLKTWDFANAKVNTSDTAGKNPLWDDNLRGDLATQVQSAGFTQMSDNPDFLVRYHLGTQEKVQTEVVRNGFPGFMYRRGGWGYWRGGWAGRTVFRTPYDESTLVVDIVDARTKELVWRGYDKQTIDADKSDKTLSSAAAKVIERFRKDAGKAEKHKG